MNIYFLSTLVISVGVVYLGFLGCSHHIKQLGVISEEEKPRVQGLVHLFAAVFVVSLLSTFLLCVFYIISAL